MIKFNNITKRYEDGTQAIRDFSLHIKKGELMTLIGPSGCGKTTTMKMVNRLIEPTSGEIYINDQDIHSYNIHELRWNIGYVLQEIALFPHMTIAENIAIVPEMKKWNRKKVKDRIHELLEMVGLDPATYAKRMPSELSGGQQQRIGVIRALAADPDIILMDEPFSALDPISREQLQQDIRALNEKIKKTILFVTHDMDEAMALGDRVCLMKDGEVIQVDTPQQLILQPKTDFVKSFIGERKSPWQTAIDVIANRSDTYTLTTANNPPQELAEEILFLKHDDGTYEGAIQFGKRVDIQPLPHDLTLNKASEIFQGSRFTRHPVVRNGKLIGTLDYEDMIRYLHDKTAMEKGGIKHG
ncbi:ATP-binding cassette domain-containing protein [Ornithinibacillus gellani]|uniref:ABC transporter ATP-binding protein n=1 Tax=Ornithinibacillus gellani TaxID=2293253 RepID=UPI000F477E64|nr:ABC transporter ATP-binding protein [Ornithinibacillus gellani]TQS74335.1 ATP-binding cassette domain-containing protein [Ornithinibacillus gellani]